MKHLFKPVLVVGTLLLFLTPTLLSHSGDVSHNNSNNTFSAVSEKKPDSVNKMVINESMVLYDSIRLKRYGLSKAAFDYAWRGYQRLLETGNIARQNVLSICDFSQSSRRKRLYIIDLREMKILINTYVAHGRNSGAEYASSFSNDPESHKSSLGFYITKETYVGSHGLSLRIVGMEEDINNKAYDRNIVVHGSDYVGGRFIKNNPFNGRSYGCPAVPAKQINQVIQTIKNGSCLFIYHPNKKYAKKSKILNG